MNSKLKIELTADGSHTIYSKKFGSTYHSKHGALQESKHIFIEQGLDHFKKIADKHRINILEVGFGTGLNAFLSLDWSIREKKEIFYTALEKYPIPLAIAEKLNYPEFAGDGKFGSAFIKLHHCDWENQVSIAAGFILQKILVEFQDHNFGENKFDLIFLDPFDPAINAECWESPFLEKLYKSLTVPAVLITYGAKGSFKRALKTTGFQIEEIPGPPGKREITRAIKC